MIPFGTRRTRRFIPWLSIAIPGLGWLIFGHYPSFATIFYSFTQYSGLPGTPLNVCGLCNYTDAFTKLLPQVSDSLRITAEYATGITIVQNAAGLAMALLLNRRGRLFGFYQALVFMPEVFSVAIVGAVFSLLFDPFSGPLEQVVRYVFHTTSSFLGSYLLALPIVMGVNIWMFTGYSMLMFSAAFGGSSQLGYGSMLAMLQFFVTVLVGGSLLILLRRREVQL